MRVIVWYIVFLFLCTFWNSNLYLYLYRRSENLECEMTDEGHSLTFSPHFPPRRFNLAQNLSILKKKDFFFMQFWFWFSNLIGVTYSYISQLTAHHFDPLLNFLMLESIFLPLTVNLSFLFKLWDWNQLHIDSGVITYHWPTLQTISYSFHPKKTCTIFVTVAVNFKILKNKQVRLCAWLWMITVLPRYVHWKNEQHTKLLAFRIPRSFLTVASPKSDLFMLFVCNLRKKYLYK